MAGALFLAGAAAGGGRRARRRLTHRKHRTREGRTVLLCDSSQISEEKQETKIFESQNFFQKIVDEKKDDPLEG